MIALYSYKFWTDPVVWLWRSENVHKQHCLGGSGICIWHCLESEATSFVEIMYRLKIRVMRS